MKKWKYHKSHKYKDADTEKEYEMITQLYKTGVYTIVNGESYWQASMSLDQMVKLEKSLEESEKEGDIKDLEFGISIIVSKVDGLYEEIEPRY